MTYQVNPIVHKDRLWLLEVLSCCPLNHRSRNIRGVKPYLWATARLWQLNGPKVIDTKCSNWPDLKRGSENNRQNTFLVSCFSFSFICKALLTSCLYIVLPQKKTTCCSSITLDPASSCNIGISRSGLFYRVSQILILPTVSSHTGTRFPSSVFCHAPQPQTLITVACRAALARREQPSVYKHVHVLSCVHLLSCIISGESCLAQLLTDKLLNK